MRTLLHKGTWIVAIGQLLVVVAEIVSCFHADNELPAVAEY